MPLYSLGDAIGAGCSSVVIQASIAPPPGNGNVSLSPASTRRRGNLAVKVIRKGAAAEALGDVERSVMWEVHVLQQLNHDHIVRVMDVIEVRAIIRTRHAHRRHTPPPADDRQL